MTLTINTNLSSLMVQLSLKKSSADMNRSIERMTTGFKINSAKDDAAGFAVASKMRVDLSSYAVVKDNTAMGLSLINTASSSLDLVTTHLQRIRDLTEEASNGTYGADSRDAIQAEINARTDEINRIMSTTEYNGIKLFEGGGTGDGGSIASYINGVNRLSEDEALAQGYTLIKTADDLNNVRNNLNGKYILMNDIDLSSYSSGEGWVPIDSFSGTLEGNGYSISNLYINRLASSNQGLFASTDNGFIISNLVLKDVNITGDMNVGGLVGINNGTITNSYITGSVRGSDTTGGLVGYNNGGTISKSYSAGTVDGNYVAGGLVGYNNGAITSCYATEAVSGSEYVGGLLGANYGTITNSYALGAVSGRTGVGGFVGDCLTTSNTMTNSYYNKETTGQSTATAFGSVAGITGVTTAELNALIVNGTLPSATKIPTGGGGTPGGGTTTGITFQIGIDSSANSQISVDTSLSLNINVNVSTTTSASNALTAIDEAIKKVTEKQTQLGAVSNRLDSVSDSIDISIQNLTSSLSTIRDADIAKESSSYIKAQILRQASASLLATANQAPSIALNLI